YCRVTISRYLFLFTSSALPDPYPLSLHDALPIFRIRQGALDPADQALQFLLPSLVKFAGLLPRLLEQTLRFFLDLAQPGGGGPRSEEHTSELQSRENLVCRLLLEKKKNPAPCT